VIQELKNATVRVYNRFIRLKGSPRQIALGFALGLFVGMSPFFGLHILIGVVLASLFGWSKIAAAIGVNITNVATAPFIYPITYWVGAKFIGFARHVRWPTELTFSQFILLLKQSPVIILDLCVGGIILGIPITIIGYYMAFNAITVYRERIRKRMRIPLRRKSSKFKEAGIDRQDDPKAFQDEDQDEDEYIN